MKIRSVCVIGGSGFLGSHVVRQLAQRGMQVRVPTRHRERAKHLIVLPTAEVVNADVHDVRTLETLISNVDAVINLAGILHERRKAEFTRAHVDLPRKIAEAARNQGTKRLIHVSALKASENGASAYLRSKAAGEREIREGQKAGIRTTIFRPSIIFGQEDRLLNLFAGLLRMFPLMPLACASARLQPIWVEDVAHAIVASLEMTECFDTRFDLCGPRVYSLRGLVEYVGAVIGKDPRIFALNRPMSYLQAWAMEMLPGRLMTRDNYCSLLTDNTCNADFPSIFGRQPATMESVVPQYLAGRTSRARYRWFRNRAAR
ncbi:MAG: complex I NDUFA9 subunit family protein [Burkholderiales bacterium]